MFTDVVLSPFGTTTRALVDAAQVAEQAGFDGVWTYDHLTGDMLGRGGSLDPFTVLGAIAVSTERVRLGPLVANMMNRHPVQLALALKTVSDLAPSRVVCGLGSGAHTGSRFADEHKAIGLELFSEPERTEHLVDTIGALGALWRGDDRFAGPHHAIDDSVSFHLASAQPPLVVLGGSSRRIIDLAVEHASGVNLTSGPRLVELLDHLDMRLEAAPDLAVDFEVSIHLPVDGLSSSSVPSVALSHPRVTRLIAPVTAPFDPGRIADLRSDLI